MCRASQPISAGAASIRFQVAQYSQQLQPAGQTHKHKHKLLVWVTFMIAPSSLPHTHTHTHTHIQMHTQPEYPSQTKEK